jgi:hypothetical protein
MTTGDYGGFQFVSHARKGLVALPGVAAAGRLHAAVSLSDGSRTRPIELALSTVADVRRLDTSLISRIYPRPGTTDAEPEFFPLVEFSVPELPWLLPSPETPTGPLPWLCLVAVAVREGVSITSPGRGNLDVLRIGGAARPSEELPDPADAALWAHAFAATTVHVVNDHDPTQVGQASGAASSRLLAARRLQPQISYFACVVPTLAAGKLGGLGRTDEDVAAALAAPQPNYAWSPSDSAVELPVYHWWEFSCGEAGDFESLARALKETPVDASFGTRPMDLGLAGPGMPDVASTRTRFRGALTAPSTVDPPTWPDPADPDQATVDTAVSAEIAAAAALTAVAASTEPNGRPAVGPLLYARAPAGRTTTASAVPPPDWFDELNRDPRNRSVAGLGTRVMRRNAEDEMARAWQQVGEVEKANAVLRRLQASRFVAISWHQRHLSNVSAGRLLPVMRPMLDRVGLTATATGGAVFDDALAAIASSALPAGSTWRSLTATLRPGTRLGACATTPLLGAFDATGRIVAGLATRGLVAPDVVPDGTVEYAPPSAVLGVATAASYLTADVRTAAATANIPVRPTGADAGSKAAALDDLVRTSSTANAAIVAAMLALTGDAIRTRPFTTPVTLAERGGRLVSEPSLHEAAQITDVPVHLLPDTTEGTLVPPEISRMVLETTPRAAPHVSVALADAARGLASTDLRSRQPVSLPIDRPTFAGSADPTLRLLQLDVSDSRLAVMRDAYASALDRFIRPGTATALPPATGFDLVAVRSAILAAIHPSVTMAKLASARVPSLAGLVRPDPVAPVMVGPVFGDPAYQLLVRASHEAFAPGVDAIPPDSVTLVQTNPTFIAAYMAGLNSAFGHELLWRGYPTDERGTYWYSFWGAGPDIPALHTFRQRLPDNVTSGTEPLLVLILKGRLLKRYPNSDIYAVVSGTDKSVPELDDATNIARPLFRDPVDPDITLVGFPLTLQQLLGTGPGTGYWFVIAEHPGEPRFGLVDPDPEVTHPPLPAWDELTWYDVDPAASGPTYVPRRAPPMSPPGTTRHWAASGADMAAITYQAAVRVAIRARDLLPKALAGVLGQ